jgi:hypothetical protein
MVTGFIGLNFHNQFESQAIFLKLKGAEKVHFKKAIQVPDGTDSEGRTKYRTEYEDHRGRNQFF